MPITFRVAERKFFDELFFSFDVLNHFFYWDIVIADGWCFAITFDAEIFQFNDQCWLMRFCAFGNGEGMNEREIVSFVSEFHCGIKIGYIDRRGGEAQRKK